MPWNSFISYFSKFVNSCPSARQSGTSRLGGADERSAACGEYEAALCNPDDALLKANTADDTSTVLGTREKVCNPGALDL